MPVARVTLQDIFDARERLRGVTYLSPCARSENLSRLTGTTLSLKLENLQMTGSFKERGACNKLLSLSAEERSAGIMTASAGNHGLAVAYHAARLAIPATVVMPESTPLVKVQSARNYGARVVLHGANYDEAAQHAAVLGATAHNVYVHPFDDPLVIAGQGTIGLELLEQQPDIEAVVSPVGGGGLVSGIAVAIKGLKPAVKIYGAQSRTVPGMRAALDAHGPVVLPPGKTLADGIAVKRVAETTLAIVSELVDDVVLVGEEEIAEAILVLLEREKTVCEGAGAVGLAALLSQLLPLEGMKVAVVLSGGNIDVNLMSRIIERGLVKTGRLVRLRVIVPDVVGSLASLTHVVAASRANILQIHHERAFYDLQVGETVVELVLETRGFEHAEAVNAAIEAEGYRVTGAR